MYELYSRVAWNGDVIAFRGGGNQSYWAVRSSDGNVVVTLVNDSNKEAKKKANIAGREIELIAPARSIVCVDLSGKEIERVTLPY